ncbi:hypothetical protein BO83DRAFT_394865 [Aspergillus eucalypticola CBS 122712]|uniref:Uncharacterized protein n=1 Tax=Aspergillus eucalypticola (strain CBS 122712 / IBT 29274) TaxID=1448314 RepID=A0A317WK78_ASPEC|nr:uncharacterized protein BO83DRAFT_394865 [Aspergillus eucalypticola CBS 122712]PWY85497.1 hypothetical protein BO83DRAFT_394865 [Aspergillus eucalypticola CBS 122712]
MNAAPFGYFIFFASVIRLLIWEKLVQEGSLAILRTSQAIYHDIADRLYNTFDIHLSSTFEDPWIEIRCKLLRVKWVIGRRDHNKFSNLPRVPYDKVKLVVHIYAPDPDDCGQFILLWEKISKLTQMLEPMYEGSYQSGSTPEAVISMVIRLRKHNGVDWIRNGQVSSTFCNNGLGYDFNEVLLPFCRLSRVRRFGIISDTEEMAVAADWAFANYATRLSQDPGYGDIARTFDGIAGLLNHRDDFFTPWVDYRFLQVPGRTLTLMRREQQIYLVDTMMHRA